MTAVKKRIRGRNVSGYVVADATALFLPAGMVTNWHRVLSNSITRETKAAAPTNKRPNYWLHTQGPKLKQSITSTSSKPDPVNRVVTSAVGSRAPYALFVDQGTKSQEAKVLPPWPGRYAFFEHTWRPAPNRPQVGRRLVQGQKAQYFFDEGMLRGMRRLGLSAVPRPGDGFGQGAMGATIANTEFIAPATGAAFRIQIQLWRAARAETWKRERKSYDAARRRQIAEINRRNKPAKPAAPAKPDLGKIRSQIEAGLKARGVRLVPGSVRVKADGTYTYIIVKPGGVQVQRNARWKK